MENENKTAEESSSKSLSQMWSDNKSLIIAIILLVILVGGSYAYKQRGGESEVGADVIKSKVEKMINGAPGVSVKSITEESGLYKITVGVEGQPEQYAYATKDGKKFIQQAVSFEEIEKQQEEEKKAEEEANKPVAKNDKPVVDLYVMSFCPYGNKSEDTMKSVYDLLKNKVDFNFHYIVNVENDSIQSLHGEKEVVQNEREACVLRDYGKDKWFSFVTYVNKNCGSDGSCWEAGARSLGINTAKVSSCASADGIALMKNNAKASDEAGATGSPTMKINGSSSKAVYQYGNSEGYKKAICDAFNTPPVECSKTLDSSTATTQGGSCGN